MKTVSEKDAISDGSIEAVKKSVERMGAEMEEAFWNTIECDNDEDHETIEQFLKELNRTPNMKDLFVFCAETGLSVSIHIWDKFGRGLCISQYGIYEMMTNDILDHIDGGLPPSGLYKQPVSTRIPNHFDAIVYINVTLITTTMYDFLLVRGEERYKIEDEIIGEIDDDNELYERLADAIDSAHLEYITVYNLRANAKYSGNENSKHEPYRWF